MEKNKRENQELVSLNTELSEFDMKELEQRLETDPLAVGGLLDVTSTSDSSLLSSVSNCSEHNCVFDF